MKKLSDVSTVIYNQSRSTVHNLTSCITSTTPSSAYNVYPAPAEGMINLQSENLIDKNIILYDLLGHIIFSIEKSSEKLISIDVSNYPKGFYFIQIMGEKGHHIEKITIK